MSRGQANAGSVVMVQGTMSNAGKSVIATALCRIFARRGVLVAPFKAQNMSLNSYATLDGGEIGRAQAVQAAAAMTLPTVQMNPVLLKPEANNRSQIVLLGKPLHAANAREYLALKARLWPPVAASLDQLRSEYELVVVEGAGSPAEINLRDREIVNMRVALYAQAPVLMVGDIERGGVFASLVGTMELLEPAERALVKGFIINKFRGDATLLDSGLDFLLRKTGVPTLGIMPYFTGIDIPEEDSVGLPAAGLPGGALLDIALVRLPHIANFDDFDPLGREPGVAMRYVETPAGLDHADLIILPGSKTTMADLEWLRHLGLDAALLAHQQRGTAIIGVCGGYQMLGRSIADPEGVESTTHGASGLGLLPVDTVFQPSKTTTQSEFRAVATHGLLAGMGTAALKGYEIHMGITAADPELAPFRVVRRSGQPASEPEGAISQNGKVLGTYMHGLFLNNGLRRGILRQLAAWKGVELPPSSDFDQDREYERLADLVEAHLDMPLLRKLTSLEHLWR